MHRPWVFTAFLVVALSVSGCARIRSTAGGSIVCGAQDQTTRHELFFGMERPDGTAIEEAEFASFLDTVITPRFPAGLTIIDAAGQYRTAQGALLVEPTKVMVLVYPDTEEVRARIAEIIATYRTRFQQESVGWVRSSACASF